MPRSCARLPRGTSGELLDLGEPVWGWGTEENSSGARRRESAEVVADREDRRRGARVDADLLHRMLDVVAGGAFADRQRRRRSPDRSTPSPGGARPRSRAASDRAGPPGSTEETSEPCPAPARRWPSPRRPPPAGATPRRWPTRPRTRPPPARRGRRRHHARGQPGRPGRPAARWPPAAPPPPRRGGRRAPVAPRRWQGQPRRPAPGR